MTEFDLARVHADLVAWGAVEPGPQAVLTKRARAAIIRAATELRAEEEKGQARPGNPMLLVAALALSQFGPPGAVTSQHEKFLAAIELASLPEGVRSMFGA